MPGRREGAGSSLYRSCIIRIAAILGAMAAVFPGSAAAQELPVIVVPGLELADLAQWEGRGAVGLLVPGAGPEVSGVAARRMLERGVIRNSLRDPLPSGTPLIDVEEGPGLGGRSAGIVLGLPRGPDQPNDRRYPIAVVGPGYRGLLTSKSTRIPGLVSIADVAPTALGRDDGASSSGKGGVETLRSLDERIDEHNRWRSRTATWVEIGVVVLAALSAPAALLGLGAVLTTNVLLGAVHVPPLAALFALLVAAAAGLALARVVRGPTRIGWLLSGVLAVYLASFVVDERWVALSPLGPTQNARFYGISNLLETLLLVPALAGAALLARRRWMFAIAALLSFVTVAGARFGADGGGALVLAAGFALLAALIWGARRHTMALALAGAAALALVLLGLEATTGASSHVTDALSGGPRGLLADLADRVELSGRRLTADAPTFLMTSAAVIMLVLLVARVLRMPLPLVRRALPLAFAGAIATSLIVNDSPKDVAVAGLACYLAVEAAALGRHSAAAQPRTRLEGRRLRAAPADPV